MFNNIGSKLKTMAKVITWAGISLSILSGMILMLASEAFILPGIVVMIVGPLSSWIGSFFIYGFGELIEQTTLIASRTGGAASANASVAEDAVSQKDAPASAKKQGKCELCGKTDVSITPAVIHDDMGTRYRDVCDECFSKYHCSYEHTIEKAESPSPAKTHDKCELCGKTGVSVTPAVIHDDMGTRYRDVCDECFSKYHCTAK